MTVWKQLSKVEKIAALQPLFARGLSYREVAAIMGTSSGAVAGFVFTNPTAKPPRTVSAEQIAERMKFGDGTAAARIAVRLKAMKASPPAGPDGDGGSPEHETGSSGDLGHAEPASDPPQPMDGDRGMAGSSRSTISKKPASDRNRSTANRAIAPIVAVDIAVPNTSSLGSNGPETKIVSVARLPSLSEPPPGGRPGPRTVAIIPAVSPPPPAGPVTLMQTSEVRCRWPRWGFHDASGGAEAQFCGAATVPGKIYCQEHRALAYTAPKAPPSAGDKSRFHLPKTRGAS